LLTDPSHLLKRLQFREDYFGERCELHYIRDRDGREVDFVTVIDKKVIDLIEVKLSDDEPTTALKYYRDKLLPQNTVQIVGDLKRSFDVKRDSCYESDRLFSTTTMGYSKKRSSMMLLKPMEFGQTPVKPAILDFEFIY